jgi:hypothetical protein
MVLLGLMDALTLRRVLIFEPLLLVLIIMHIELGLESPNGTRFDPDFPVNCPFVTAGILFHILC